MFRVFAVFIFLVFISGCSHLPLNHAKNIIAIDRLGSPQAVMSGDVLENKKFIDNINESLAEVKGKTILIHIHGGLNLEGDSNDRAEIIASILEKEKPQQYYPFFIHWKSGPFTSLNEHLFFDRQGEYWPIVGPLTSPFVLAEDLGRGIVRAPMVWWYQTNSFMSTLPVTKYLFERQKNAAQVDRRLGVNNEGLKEVTKISTAEGEGIFNDPRGALEIFGDGVLGGFKLIFGLTTAPIFDSLGTGAWKNMKRRTDVSVFRSESDEWSEVGQYISDREGALYTFFNQLADAQKKDSTLKIVIVGHSMGSIIASRILSEFPTINFDRIIFMAAACSLDDFRVSVLPHLQKQNSTTRFYNLMLHPIAENQEAHLLGFGGTGTLLNQIDSIYQDPVSEGKRTLGRYVNVMNNINLFTEGLRKDEKERIYLRTMQLQHGYPQKHGDFSKVRKLKKSQDGYLGCLPYGPFWDEGFGAKDLSESAGSCKK